MSGIIANGLYKIFGKDPARGVQALRTGTTRTELRDQGLTAAVIDASFEVVPGKCSSSWGYPEVENQPCCAWSMDCIPRQPGS